MTGTSEEATWKYVLPVTVEGVVALSLSRSYISALPEGEREIVADNGRVKSWLRTVPVALRQLRPTIHHAYICAGGGNALQCGVRVASRVCQDLHL